MFGIYKHLMLFISQTRIFRTTPKVQVQNFQRPEESGESKCKTSSSSIKNGPVFMYPLGLLPWSLADAYGLLRKTNKAQLFKELEKNVPVSERHLTNVSNIYDGILIFKSLSFLQGLHFDLWQRKYFRQLPTTSVEE